MTSAAPPKPPAGPSPSRPGPPPGAPAQMASIDPIKLLKKWKYVLAASVAVGIVFGVVGHFTWARVYPIFVSTVVYEVLPPQESDLLDPTQIDEDALEQFMGTEAARMMSLPVLEKVVKSPQLLAEAPKWSSEFVQDDGTFDWQTALEELESRASARPIGGTYNIELKVSWKDKNDVAALATMLKNSYMELIRDTRGRDNRLRRDAIQRSINDIKQETENLTEARGRLIRDQDVSSINEQTNSARGKLQLIARDRNMLLLEIRRMEVQLEKMNDMVNSESGVRYSDSQRAMAEQRPIVQGMKNEKQMLETRLNELRRSGFLPSHREYKRVERQIAALEQQLSATIERELASIFDAEKDMLESELRAARAQVTDLVAREEVLENELIDLTRTIREINDLTNEISSLNQTLADRRGALADLETTSSMEDATNRIRVDVPPRVPDRKTHPQLILMIPLGVFVISGLVGSTILAAEFLDQRIKSAADLAAMPRMTILGTVPLAGEDPTASSNFETIFRDADRSVISESFRQIRTGLLKTLDEGGHKSVLIVSGMPGAGSTSMVTNFGFACAAVDRRVLIIDANFRRPAMHRVFGTKEAPGLGDVLAGEASLEDVVQQVAPNLWVLPVGTPANRVFERLNTQPMTSLLSRVTAEYDLAFVDVAPAVVAGDAKALAQRCDASILITRAMAEKRGMVARIKNELADSPATLLGVVLNAVRSAAGGYMKRNIRTSTAYHIGGGPAQIAADRVQAKSDRAQAKADKSSKPAEPGSGDGKA